MIDRRILLIGEAPGKGWRPGDAPLEAGGRAGRRLAGLMGISDEDYAARVAKINLLPDWHGKSALVEEPWPTGEARARAIDLLQRDELYGRAAVVFLGRRVAAAFTLDVWPWFRPLRTIRGAGWTLRTLLELKAGAWYVAPHPSGASRWWNDPRNAARARRFWRTIGRRVLSSTA